MVLRLVIVLFIVKAQADIRTVVVWFQIDQKVVDEDDYGDDDGSDDHEGYLVDDNYNDHGEHEDGVDNDGNDYCNIITSSKGGLQKLLNGFFPLRGGGVPPIPAKGFWAG